MSTDQLLHRLRNLLADRYRFETYLGRGGSASVYTVRNLRLDRLEAFKVLADSQQGDTEFTTRFANEAKLAASLDHPNIVKVYDFGDHEGICWFSMQLIEGPSLSAELHSRRTFDPETAIQLFLPILDALHFSHERGIVHRDVKPSNIIVERRGRPFLMDFGIAKSAGSMLETRTGLVLGTPAYVAPEQASGKSDIDGRADIYAVGVTLYQLLCGGYPFTADNPLQTVVMRMTQDPEPLKDKLPDINPRLHEIIMRSLARDRDLRFEDAGAMRSALADLQGTLRRGPVFVPQATGPGRGRSLSIDGPQAPRSTPTMTATRGPNAGKLKWDQRNRQIRAATWFAGAAMVVAIGVFSVLGTRARDVAEPETSRSPSTVEMQSTANPPGPIVVPSPTSAAIPSTIEPDDNPQHAEAESQSVSPQPAPTLAPSSPSDAPEYRRPFDWPKLLSDPRAEVPPELVTPCSGERVRLSLKIDERGSVISTRVISAGHAPGCIEYAEATVQQWLYEPAKDIEGVPVAATLTVSLLISEENDDA